MSEEFKAITTQKEFDDRIKDRLEQQERKYSDYEEIKNKNTKLEQEIGTLKTTNAELSKNAEDYDKNLSEKDAKISGYEKSNLRTKIALEKGLPYDLADRLVGDDETSIQKDADRLASFIKNNEPPAPLKSSEPPLGDGKDGAYKSLIENLDLEGE